MPDGTASPTHPVPKPSTAGFETIHVDETTVACDGGGGALGHPRVFLRIEPEPPAGHPTRRVMCPYCSRLYVLNEGASHGTGH